MTTFTSLKTLFLNGDTQVPGLGLRFSFEGPLFNLLPSVALRRHKAPAVLFVLWPPAHTQLLGWANHCSSRRVVGAAVSVMAV